MRKMLKFETIATIGEKIRAYDFEPMHGREECFIEGFIQAITSERGYSAFEVLCVRDSMIAGKFSRIGHIVYVPLETNMDYDNRVSVIN
jgi:hypothetical protein